MESLRPVIMEVDDEGGVFIHEREVIWLARVVLTCVGVWGGIIMVGWQSIGQRQSVVRPSSSVVQAKHRGARQESILWIFSMFPDSGPFLCPPESVWNIQLCTYVENQHCFPVVNYRTQEKTRGQSNPTDNHNQNQPTQSFQCPLMESKGNFTWWNWCKRRPATRTTLSNSGRHIHVCCLIFYSLPFLPPVFPFMCVVWE